MAYPLKEKSSSEVLQIFLYYIWPLFNTSVVITDNARIYTSAEFRNTLQALNIKVPRISSRNPSANSYAEQSVLRLKIK